MIHSRVDYSRIQDPAGLIPEDEPVFLLRAQDKTAPQVIRLWAAAQRQNPKVDPAIIYDAERQADRMEAYGHEHGTQWPDLPEKPR